jgi:hypothetical protein
MVLQVSVTHNLSFGMYGEEVARVQQAIQALGRDISAAERAQRIFGPDTVAVLKALQADLGAPVTGVADTATIRAINAKLASSVSDARMVRGTVHDANGSPLATGLVQVFTQNPAGEENAGKSPISGVDGSYEISYTPAAADGRINFRVAVFNAAGSVVETVPSGASILTNAGPLEVVDFVLSGAANQPRSDFELILGDLRPLLGTRNLADLVEDATRHDISLLASQSGYSSAQIAALALAHQLERDTKTAAATPAPVFYALIDQGLPAHADALLGADPDSRLKALQAAVAQGVVPSEIGGKKIEDFLTGLAPAPPAQLQGLLGHILNPSELKNFVGRSSMSSQDPAAFWKQVKADPALADRADELEFTVQVAALTDNHLPLVTAVQAMPGITTAADLVRLTDAQWTALVQTNGVGVPAGTPGASADEQTSNYVQQIVGQVEAAFPTLFLAERLGPSPVTTFLKEQPSYDLTATYPARFFKDNPAAAQSLSAQDRQQLQAFHRLYRLTGNAKETIGLQGVGSALKISRLDRQAFADQHKEVLSADRASEIYDKAVRQSALALALLGQHGAGFNQTGLRVLPQLDLLKQADEAASAIPDWETLFGTFDLCACQDCASAHGPAAYYVDILRFLGDRGARATLFGRRPDLGDIELSCENTNTTLPVIDLVTEVLENAVTPPAAFVPVTLPPGLEADLAQTVATTALTAAFNPPLQSGARVETLEAGQRWRIWDEPFAYSVVKDHNALTAVARSRQTAGSPDERRASPQFRNAAAYGELADSVFPWKLPFGLPGEEANVFLAHLGVPRRDLIEALSPPADPFDPNAPVVVRLAAEGLGLTDTERKIIVGEPLSPPRAPEDFWGSAPVTALTTVRDLLDRSGLAYADLEALITTWFINPGGTVTISAKPGMPADTCDTTKLQLNGLTADVLDRLHRFVRLHRKLGWTIPELDRALHAMAPNPVAPAVTDDVMVRIDHLRSLGDQLRLPVMQTLALWKPIDTAEPDSLYRSLFYNPAVFKPQDDDFRLRADGQELVTVSKLLMDQAAALQAAFRLSAENLTLLAAQTDGRLTLANLSVLYRHATLARQLGLTVQNLLTAIDLTGIDPFRADRSQDTLRFAEVINTIRTSDFDLPQLDYLLRHRFNSAASFVPAESTLAQVLADIRTGLLKVDASAAEQQKLQQGGIIDRVSAALGLPADLTGRLLELVTHAGVPAQSTFVQLSSIAGPSLSRDNARPQFEILEKLLKIAATIRTLELPASQLDWLLQANSWLTVAPDPPAAPVPFANWFTLIELQQLRHELTLEDGALEAILGAVSAVGIAADQAARLTAKKALVDALSGWLGWRQDDLEALVGEPDTVGDQGLLKARLPDDYRLDLILRLNRAMGLIKRLETTAAQAAAWCGATVSDADANAIRRAAKARYDDAAWQKLAVPLQNSLRDKQREALVSYLVTRPEKWPPNAGQVDADDLLSHFLIDVEMSSCQLTSRIKQAIGSVQLFAQRCLLGLEPGVQTEDPKWEQWAWMKNFRVWEANRKVWLYPENWIEPELRDDKSPFFTALESELLQSDLTDDAAEQAVLRYLEKLDEVARLEIAGVYEDDDKVLHVFGRTIHTPHLYYYRRRENGGLAWTPWDKVELDIEGDHLIPVVWNRKLMLIWPIFTEKQEAKPVIMPPPGNQLESADSKWEIKLAWSEYRNGAWSGKYLSDPVTLKAYLGVDNILFGDLVPAPVRTTVVARINNGDGISSDSPDDGGGPARLVPAELISFKALASGETLRVRGFLRRDYRSAASPTDSQIAYPFGEFRFLGCRKIVTTASSRQIAQSNIALAPTGTKFDRMWFTETAPALVLFDGIFPVGRVVQDNVFSITNEPASIASDPASTVANKQDIPVLDQTFSAFKLLAPPQDLQFVGDRPFFFMDGKRTFMITSTGRKRLPVAGWTDANVATAWRADYFPPPPIPAADGNDTTTNFDGPATAPFTLLVPAPGGRRIAQQTVPVDLKPAYSPKTLLPVITRQYRFANFHHPYLCEFEEVLGSQGLPGLFSLETQSQTAAQSFDDYKPEPRVLPDFPVDEVEFQSGRAYEAYNWELFFHIPLLIAARLSSNQRFAEAQRWFHYIFDPTGGSGGEVPQRYWHTKPFNDRLNDDYEAQSVGAIEKMIANGATDELKAAVAVWRSNPFSPHAVARLRTTAYQKTVVMKYVDNLIAWGDQLFRNDTLETINEATQLYVLAADILGRRPEVIKRNLAPAVETFNSIEPKLGSLGNALENIELLIADPGDAGSTTISPLAPDPPSDTMLYFCVPQNDKLLAYWDTVADRLFKIRHCMNIEGQVQQLPLFEPPIDPALLVRAQAAGLSIGEVLSDIPASLPNYRFSVMLQKANELAAEVRNLGGMLLSVLEKRDAEALSTLRSGQELRMLQAVRDIRVNQVDEATANIAALQASQQLAQARKDYYGSREPLSLLERSAQDSFAEYETPLTLKRYSEWLSTVLHLVPTAKAGAPTTIGIEYGGGNLGSSVAAFAASMETTVSLSNNAAGMTNRLAEYQRRQDEWTHQANLATIELKQIDKQSTAAQIRLAIAEQELRNHDQQIGNARETDQFLRNKFTNQDLFSWMAGQVSGLYFQSYQLAYDFAKRAEVSMQHELGLADGETSFIRFGYWDSLKKGLLAGDQLAFDLKRLDVAYLDGNVREFELTKHVSLLQLDPLALIQLRETGRCFFGLPEEIFDLDYPGHYFRRIKSVSLTLPSVTGPYTTISCTLRLLRNSIRTSTDTADGYPRNTDPSGFPADDPRFRENTLPVTAIAASSAQNDSGMFELNFHDERYLPFERAGAISGWSLELLTDPTKPDFGRPLRQFDYGTITDAVLHLKYTAREDAGPLKTGAIGHLREYFARQQPAPALLMLNLRRDFPSQWSRLQNPANPADGNVFELEMSPALFPARDTGKTLQINTIVLLARCTDPDTYTATLTPPLPAPPPPGANTIALIASTAYGGLHLGQRDVADASVEIAPARTPATWQIRLTRPGGGNLTPDPVTNEPEVQDLMLVVGYAWE